MTTNDCQLAWMNALSNRVFKTYEEAFNDAKSDLLFKSNRKKTNNEFICKFVKLVYLWI